MSKSIDRFVKLLNEFGYDSVKNQISEECPLTREFANFISSVCANINKIVCTEENVSHVEKDDLQDWKLELGSFLRELQCPYDQLYTGEISERLENFGDRFVLVEFLHDELIAAQKVHSMSQNGDKNLNLQPIFGILNAIKLSQPPSNISTQKLFSKIVTRIDQEMPTDMKQHVISEPLFTKTLNESQWTQLNNIAKQLEGEYALRRTMLSTRLSATLQSFSWSERAKSMPRYVAEAISSTSFATSKFSHINAADVLAARRDLLKIKKISSEAPDTRSSNPLTKVKVGRVPDRGGRPSETAPPPPEMPSWEKRSGQAHDANNFKGQRGGHRGGGHHGGGHGGQHGGGHHGGGGGHHGGGGRNKNRGVVQDARWKKNY